MSNLLQQRRRVLRACSALPLAMLLPGLPACTGSELKLAIHPWIGYEPLLLARDFGWLGPNVRLAEGKSLTESAQALSQGEADAACLTLDEVLILCARGLDLRAVLVFDVSAGADVVMSKPTLLALTDLAGRRIGREPNALGQLMLEQTLMAAGLKRSAVTVVDLTTDAQVQAWKTDRVDAVISYEPTATLLEALGAHRLLDSRQFPDTIIDVLAVRSERIAAIGPSLRTLIRSHFRALSYLYGNHQDALHRIAAHEAITPQEARLVLAGINLPSLSANRVYLAAGTGQLHAATAKLARLMQNLGLLNTTLPTDHLLADDWLPTAET